MKIQEYSVELTWFMFEVINSKAEHMFIQASSVYVGFLFRWESANCVYKPWEDAGKKIFHEDFVNSGGEEKCLSM